MKARLARSVCAGISGLYAVLCIAGPASAQDGLAKARALYDAAAYEEALTVLGRVEAPEGQQYRALCMLALGRSQDAAGAVESLVSSSPTFEPSAEDVPPRFVTLVSDAKRKLLPAIARRTFTEAREQFRKGEREEALRKFDLVLTLTSSSTLKDTSDAEDLRTLAAGFIDLARASTPSPTPKVAEAPGSVEPPAPTLPPDVLQPVAIKQVIPPVPTDVARRSGPAASVRVLIGVDGKVTRSTIEQSAHPLYDRMLLAASSDWLFKPASLNGKAIPSEKVVTIQIR